MKISRLEFKNCLGIKEFKLSPEKITLITGGNGKGKTSILESIEKAISNKDRRVKFVNDDADKAELIVELDNGIAINRKVNNDNKSNLKVVDGTFPISSPETFLKSLLGGFGFNPIDFVLEKDENQAEMLLSIIPMNVTIDDFEGIFGDLPDGINYNMHPLKIFKQIEKKFYDAKTVANTEHKTIKAEIDAIFNQLPENYKAEEYRNIVLSDLYKEIDEKQKTNEIIKIATDLVNNEEEVREKLINEYKGYIAESVQDLNNEILELKNKIIVLETQRDERELSLKAEGNTKVTELKERILKAKEYISTHSLFDIQTIKIEAENTEKMKNFVSLHDNRIRLAGELAKKQNRADMLDEQVKTARTKPLELLKAFELPVKGLEFDNDMKLLINGRAIKNLSTSEQITVALDIAKATSGELKLLCIDKFESVDVDIQNEILEQIKDDDFQYFITQVTNGDMKLENIGVSENVLVFEEVEAK